MDPELPREVSQAEEGVWVVVYAKSVLLVQKVYHHYKKY